MKYLLVVFLLNSGFLQAHQNDSLKTQQPNSEAQQISVAEESKDDSKHEIELLKVKLDTLEAVNTKLLNSVYITLGLLLTIFIAVITINAVSNYQLNVNKYNSLQQSLKDKVEQSITAQIADAKKEVTGEVGEDLNTLNRQVQTLFRFQKEVELKELLTELKGEEFRYLPGEFKDLITLADKDKYLDKELNTKTFLPDTLDLIRLFVTKYPIDQENLLLLNGFLSSIDREDVLPLIQQIKDNIKTN